MVETRLFASPHFDLLRRKARGPSASIGLDTKGLTLSPVITARARTKRRSVLVSGRKRPRRACARLALGNESRRIRREWT